MQHEPNHQFSKKVDKEKNNRYQEMIGSKGVS